MLLAGTMVLSLVACGTTAAPAASAPAPAAAPAASAEAPAAAPEAAAPAEVTAETAEITMLVGSTVQDDSASGIAVLEYLKPYIEEHSNGRIFVDVKNNSVLGGDRDLYEALQLNTLQCDFGPMSVLANFEPSYSVTDFPSLFESKEEAYAMLDGEFGQALAAKLPAIGMRLLAYGENAFRNIANSKRPINTLEDCKGLKIRVMESPAYIETFSALGCTPTPMAFSEVYTALQQGTVDGHDNGVVLAYTSKFYEVQPYYAVTGQQYAANGIIVSEAFWQSLPEDLQKVVEDGAKYAMENQRRMNNEQEEELLKVMQDAGVEVTYLSDEEKEKFREATLVVWDKLGGTIDPEILAMAIEIRDN